MSAALGTSSARCCVSRRKAESQWIDYTWHRPHPRRSGGNSAWTGCPTTASAATFYAGSAVLELFRGEASNYRDNLAGDNSLWVILRPAPGEPPYELAW